MAPVLLGVIPFGVVFGATAVDSGMGIVEVLGFSIVVFAGASQLAAVELLGDGGAVLVTSATIWVINLRHLMYGASLGTHLAGTSRPGRWLGAYLLTDQAYVVTVSRCTDAEPLVHDDRVPYLIGAGLGLWATWQAASVAGALLGAGIPDEVPLDFAVPLVFLTLLVPALRDRPSVLAAVVGGAATVAVAEAGLPDAALLLGALVGIAAGTIADAAGPSANDLASPGELT